MPISQGDQLFLLVKSMTKSEKRSFTAFATRFQDSDGLMYLKLFEQIEKQKDLDENYLCHKLKIKDKTQYSNLKRHLYKQILSSMRMAQITKNSDIQIREYLDYVDLLYARGLYLQALKILSKAKALAQKTNNDILYLAIVETEKNIESKHITRTGINITENLVSFTEKISETINNASKLSNLRLLMHSYYIQNGHVQSQAEERKIKDFFYINMPDLNEQNLSYIERVYLSQSYVWYYYILLDFENCLINAEKWVSIFNQAPEMIVQDPDLYMRGYHYILTCAYNLQQKKKFNDYHRELEAFRKENYHRFSQNSKIISFLYVHHSRLNQYFLEKKFQEGTQILQKTVRRINLYKSKLDSHRIMVFYFKIAWMYMMAGVPSKAVDYLNEIFKMEIGALREDIQTYSHIMFLMAHFDLGNETIMEYLLNSAKNHFNNSQQINKLQSSSLKFFAKIVNTPLLERKTVIQKFMASLEDLKNDKYEKRAFLYLDVPYWLEQKMKHR